MCVEERWTMVTSASCSQSAPQMSKAELFEPITTTLRPRYASGPGCRLEWCCSPRNTSCPGRLGEFGLPDLPVAKTSWAGRNSTDSPSRWTVTCHVPASASYRADRTSARDQYGTSMTVVYISSQSAILSLGANTGQFDGNGR